MSPCGLDCSNYLCSMCIRARLHKIACKVSCYIAPCHTYIELLHPCSQRCFFSTVMNLNEQWCRTDTACYQEFIIIYRKECSTLIYPCRRAYCKVMMQQQGFVVCDVPEVKNLSKLPSFPTLRTPIFVNCYASSTFASYLDP